MGVAVDDELAHERRFVLGQRLALRASAARPARARSRRAAGGSPGPTSSRSPGVALLPSTRSCPVRAQRETRLKLTSGMLRLNQRSSRMPSSSSETMKLRGSAMGRRLAFRPPIVERCRVELADELPRLRAPPTGPRSHAPWRPRSTSLDREARRTGGRRARPVPARRARPPPRRHKPAPCTAAASSAG